ncbi:MAG: hypothetical protein H6597_04780 [Flavobacteriales bacterium]|nr:hypothetical protein [Flavobacteriales bacterium]MCB9193828.1 hypothetical protein [Flavobacteriales bacterium]
MRIYRFRVLVDHPNEAFRDIEVGSEQNFLDLHHAIKQAFGFAGEEMASFYVSDEEWGKGPEIPLADLGFGEEPETPPALMEDVFISDHIRSTKQRFIYVYDFLYMWLFMVELIGAFDPEEKATYPRVVLAMGASPDEHSKEIDLSEGILEEEDPYASEEVYDPDEGLGDEDGHPDDDHGSIDDLGEEYH